MEMIVGVLIFCFGYYIGKEDQKRKQQPVDTEEKEIVDKYRGPEGFLSYKRLREEK